MHQTKDTFVKTAGKFSKLSYKLRYVTTVLKMTPRQWRTSHILVSPQYCNDDNTDQVQISDIHGHYSTVEELTNEVKYISFCTRI